MLEFKLRYRELRKTLGITLREMSSDLSIPLSSISKYEQGLIKPGVEILSRIAKAYKVNLNWLITGEGPMFLLQNELLMIGGTDALRVRYAKYEDKVKIHPLSNELVDEFKPLKKDFAKNPVETLKKLVKKLNKPICVEFSGTDNQDSLKLYFPDGKIETHIKDETIKKSDVFNDLRSKIVSISDDNNKLDFVNTAIDALGSKSSFFQLKTLMQGMEIIVKERA
ncbi:MAG: helix-turn-helix transcriptional regulator [Candidatus Gastranaerophilales bacterium]|nr:helix-turn-helix transcriptional regulator [Candidatus Gastranaerophilales bacterium]